MNLLRLKNTFIFDQLKLEEALLRTSSENWCIINEGSSKAIVMGISGAPHLLVDLEKAKNDKIPLIKRFSGGGTVIVDEETIFITFLCQKSLHPECAFASDIMKWSEDFYIKALNLEGFHLKENDYVLSDKKCGGNAQYVRKENWLHHTSFLYDYSLENMNYLLHPPKTPSYRKERSHKAFLTKLNSHFSSKEHLIEKIITELQKRYPVTVKNSYTLSSLLESDHRKTVALICP